MRYEYDTLPMDEGLWIFSWKLNGKIFILQKFFDGKENVWEEDEEDSWSIDSFNLPDWLRRFL